MSEYRTTDIVIGAAVMVLALTGVLVLIPSGIASPGEVEIEALAPDFWPRLVIITLGIAGACVFLQGTVFCRDAGAEADSDEDYLPFAVSAIKLTAAIAILFACYVAISTFGIVLSSAVTGIALMMLGGERRPLLLLAVAILLPVLLYYFFTHVAGVPLPLGLFES